MGSAKRVKSPNIEKPALAYQKIVVLRQTPGIDLFHVREMGVHWKTEASVVAIPNAVTKPRRTQHAKRKRF
jgi:hypothetical protein